MSREEHIQRYGCCATCLVWERTQGGVGQCWSGDRLDDDLSQGSAGTTYAYDYCEAHCDREPIDVEALKARSTLVTSSVREGEA